ncbi:glycosyl hydrolase family 26, partial [Vibrio cholerae]
MKALFLSACITLLTACSGENELMQIREQVSTVDVKIENEGQKPEVIYSANIRSNTIFCVGKVNNVQMLSNLKTRSG